MDTEANGGNFTGSKWLQSRLANRFRFFADDQIDLVARKFFASFTFKSEKTHSALPWPQLPSVRFLKAKYANLSELLRDIEDLPTRGGLVDRVTAHFGHSQWREDEISTFCTETKICNTCPGTGTSLKKLCDHRCAKAAATPSTCDLTGESGCPNCDAAQTWCPQVPVGESCPPKPICPANLCDILRNQSDTLMSSSRSIDFCSDDKTAEMSALQASRRAARCKWVLESSIRLADNHHQSSQFDEFRRRTVPSSDDLVDQEVAPSVKESMARQADNMLPLFADIKYSSTDWPSAIGRAFEATIGSFWEIGAGSEDKPLEPRQAANMFYGSKFLASIMADLLRRMCSCPKCELFGRELNCDCRRIIFYKPIKDQAAKVESECRELRLCRPCRSMNQCPVPLGCNRQPLCQDCADIKLNEVGQDDPWLAELFDDQDSDSKVTETDLEHPFKLPEKCEFCDDFRSCGKVPSNVANLSSSSSTQQYERRNAMNRIIGGRKADRNNWPFFVHVETLKSEGSFECGGVLISRRHVLTAGHCVSSDHEIVPATNVRVTTGQYHLSSKADSNAEDHFVADICRLKNYFNNPKGGTRYDLALLTLTTDVEFNHYVQPACLPRNLNLFSRAQCYLIGLGRAGSVHDEPAVARYRPQANELQEVEVKRVSCNMWSLSDNDRSRHCFTGASGPADSCDGDSGAPIVCKNKLGRWAAMGVVSYGSPACTGNAPQGWVGVYARIPTLLGVLANDCKLFA